jgi:anthranilate phosphoribosyltransferase
MSTGADLAPLLKHLATGEKLSPDEIALVFGAMFKGEASPVQMASFLTALTVRGPSVEEIAAAARVMRSHMIPVQAPEGAIDVVGTGGDGQSTLNVSTATSLVVAACGVCVAKHGNRAMSSRSGAADVLEALGVKLDLSPAQEEISLRDAGICFLFAQGHHPALKHVGPVRRELGFRTLFNLLGPLANPAGVKRQLLGVYDAAWVEPVARTLAALGSERAWVVHGSDGIDEISLSGPTKVAALENGAVRSFEVVPEDAGLDRKPLSALKGGDPQTNAAAVRRLLDGEKSAFRDVVLLNAAAALIVAGKTSHLRGGVALAAASIDNGGAKKVLEKLVAVSQGAGS